MGLFLKISSSEPLPGCPRTNIKHYWKMPTQLAWMLSKASRAMSTTASRSARTAKVLAVETYSDLSGTAETMISPWLLVRGDRFHLQLNATIAFMNLTSNLQTILSYGIASLKKSCNRLWTMLKVLNLAKKHSWPFVSCGKSVDKQSMTPMGKACAL